MKMSQETLNRKTAQRLHEKVLELTTLYEIGKVLSSSLDLDKTFNGIMKILSQFLGMRRGTLALYHPETDDLRIDVAYGLTPEEMQRGRFKVGEGVTGKVFKLGVPSIVPDIGREPLFLNKTKARGDIRKENVSFLSVPVKMENRVVGVLSVDRLFSQEISFEEDLRLLAVIASTIGQALRLHEMVMEEKRQLLDENQSLKKALKGRYSFQNLVGQSLRMQDVYEMVEAVSRGRTTVLLLGESGTGKELIARAIHFNSDRAERPFIKIDCAALPESLLESELFGHEKGAFTGAQAAKPGRFELADGGTLFLDEIGNLSLPVQAKLLRVLQDRTFERIGGMKSIQIDVRIVAATNRDLEQVVKAGTFREDLYYRLHVVPIHLPPLRERADDIPALVEHFLRRFNEENGTRVERVSREALERMMHYPWPGNVRELEHCIERMVVMGKGRVLGVDDLPLSIRQTNPNLLLGRAKSSLKEMVREIEKKMIQEALRQHNHVRSRAARALGVTERILNYKVKKYAIL